MPPYPPDVWYVFEVRHRCHHVESHQVRLVTDHVPYDMLPYEAFHEIKQRYRRRWCARCDLRRRPLPPRRRRVRVEVAQEPGWEGF